MSFLFFLYAFLNLSESCTATYPPSFNSNTQDTNSGSPTAEHRVDEDLKLGKKNEAKTYNNLLKVKHGFC